jgi:hypothetical protein
MNYVILLQNVHTQLPAEPYTRQKGDTLHWYSQERDGPVYGEWEAVFNDF